MFGENELKCVCLKKTTYDLSMATKGQATLVLANQSSNGQQTVDA